MVFFSRQEAGKLLAEKLIKQQVTAGAVFGLARGGLPVAAEIAQGIGRPLLPLLVKKIGAPGNPEFAVGAVALPEGTVPSGNTVVWWNKEVIGHLNLSPKWQQEQLKLVKRQIAEYRAHLPKMVEFDCSGKSVIITDDGAATGGTMLAAIRALRQAGVKTIVVALPVASLEAAADFRRQADRVVILHEDPHLAAVGQYYRHFEQVDWKDTGKLLSDLGVIQ